MEIKSLPVIDIQSLSKTYFLGHQQQLVLNDVSLSVNAGELISIMGASGSGKTTLMNLIGLLDIPSQGNYRLNGQEVSKLNDDQLAYIRNHTIGFVFQSFFLLPRLNALQNVALPLLYSDKKIPNSQEHCMNLLKRVGMERWARNKPNELSGGQMQRVAIARSLVVNPSVILADEPTGSLDSKIGQEVMDLFREINQHDKATIVIVTHDPKIAEQCDRIVHVADGKVIS